MHTFILTPKAVEDCIKKIQRRIWPITGVSLILLIVFKFWDFFTGGTFDSSGIFFVFLMAIIFVWTDFRVRKSTRHTLSTFRLIVDEDSIIRESGTMPRIAIRKDEVSYIVKGIDGSYVVAGGSTLNAINIPAGIDQPELLDQLLSGIRPMVSKGQLPSMIKYGLPALTVLGIIGMGSVFLEDALLSVIGMSFTCLFFVVVFAVIQRSKNVERRIKRTSYIMFIPLLSFLAVIISKLIGMD
jgi:hypothetical protein